MQMPNESRERKQIKWIFMLLVKPNIPCVLPFTLKLSALLGAVRSPWSSMENGVTENTYS